MCLHGNARRVFKLLLFALMLLPAVTPRLMAEVPGRVLVKSPRPMYPELAKQMRVEGSIVLLISILPDGHVADIRVASGHPMLVQAAEAAVREWRYASSHTTTITTVSVDFHLH